MTGKKLLSERKENRSGRSVRSIGYRNRGQESHLRAGDETVVWDLREQREKIMSSVNLSGLQTSMLYDLAASVSIFDVVSINKCITITLNFILSMRIDIPGINYNFEQLYDM